MSPGKDVQPDAAPEDVTGVPLFGTWRAVYAVVLGAFAVYVVALTWFAWHFTRVKP